MSFWDDITGRTASDAANAAAADKYTKEQDAIRRLLASGDEYSGNFDALASNYTPYMETGGAANSALARLLADPSSVSSLPGYGFDLSEGLNGLDRSAAARGMLNSGRQSKDVLRFATGLADKTYGSQLQRLMSGAQLGIGATQGYNSTRGQGYNGLLDTRKTAYGGQMQSAGTIGQGMVAGANAESAGMSNLLGMGLNLAGKVAGMGFGGSSGGWTNPDSLGGRVSSYLAPTPWYAG